MATVTRENISVLNDKLTVKLSKEDYFPAFEQSLKKYAKNANIPGFRKGMVPAGVIKKMYGQSVFTEEILRTVEKELTGYLEKEKLDIIAQPLPLDSDARMLDMNNQRDYAFAFEIGLKPEIKINPKDIHTTRYKVQVTDKMIDDEISYLQMRYGKMFEAESISSNEDILTLQFTETDAEGKEIENGINKTISLRAAVFSENIRSQLPGKKKEDSFVVQLSQAFEDKQREEIMQDLELNKDNPGDANRFFKILITKISQTEKAEINEEFFENTYPSLDIKTEDEFRKKIKRELETLYEQQSRNQLHDQIYHYLIDNTYIEFPEKFLKRWLQYSENENKTPEDAEREYPGFLNNLKWSFITSQLINEYNITVEVHEIEEYAKQQVFQYMNVPNADEMPWINEYAKRMLDDKKFVEKNYIKLQTGKLFSFLESQVQQSEEEISAEEFSTKLHHHH